MLNKTERAEMESLLRDNAYLRKRIYSAEEKMGEAQETILDLELLFERFQSEIGKGLKTSQERPRRVYEVRPRLIAQLCRLRVSRLSA